MLLNGPRLVADGANDLQQLALAEQPRVERHLGRIARGLGEIAPVHPRAHDEHVVALPGVVTDADGGVHDERLVDLGHVG